MDKERNFLPTRKKEVRSPPPCFDRDYYDESRGGCETFFARIRRFVERDVQTPTIITASLH